MGFLLFVLRRDSELHSKLKKFGGITYLFIMLNKIQCRLLDRGSCEACRDRGWVTGWAGAQAVPGQGGRGQ